MIAKLKTLEELLKESWTIFKKGFPALGGLSLAGSLPVVLGGMLFENVTKNGFGGNFWQYAVGGMLLVGFLIPAFVWSIWVKAGLYAILKELMGGRKVGYESLGKILNEAKGFALSLWWVEVLAALAVFGGMAGFVVGGVVAGVYLSLSSYVVAYGKERRIGALEKSVSLVRGNFLPVLGRMAPVYLFIYLGLFGASVWLSTALGNSIAGQVLGVGVGLLQWGAGLWVLVYQGLIYRDLSEVSEKEDGKRVWWVKWLVAGGVALGVVVGGLWVLDQLGSSVVVN